MESRILLLVVGESLRNHRDGAVDGVVVERVVVTHWDGLLVGD